MFPVSVLEISHRNAQVCSPEERLRWRGHLESCFRLSVSFLGVNHKRQYKFNFADALFLQFIIFVLSLSIDFVVLLFSVSCMVNKVIPQWGQQWLGIGFHGLAIGNLCQMDDGNLGSAG